MGKESRSWVDEPGLSGITRLFGQHFSGSEQFEGVFRQGMELVERTAAYLDGQGRQDAKRLTRGVALTYATESMRLTARLLDLASWLLIRRSLLEGEITEEEAQRKRARLKLRVTGRPGHVAGFEELPGTLQKLIEESFTLADRIVRIDNASTPAGSPAARASNPVAAQIAELQAAFNAAIR